MSISKLKKSENESSNDSIKSVHSKLENLVANEPVFDFEGFPHHYRLIFSYPILQEFLSLDELKSKIAKFYDLILKETQYALLYKVNRVAIGQLDDYYLISFEGRVSAEYIENELTEVADLLASQLNGYFLCLSSEQLSLLYFELDKQVIIKPSKETQGIPSSYDGRINFWDFALDSGTWSVLEGTSELIFNLAEVSTEVLDSTADVTVEAVVIVGETASEALESGVEIGGEIIGAIFELIGNFLAGIIGA